MSKTVEERPRTGEPQGIFSMQDAMDKITPPAMREEEDGYNKGLSDGRDMATRERSLSMARFHNALRIMRNIDRDELVKAGVLDDDRSEIGDALWGQFNADASRFFIRLPTPLAEKLWALIESRQPPEAT